MKKIPTLFERVFDKYHKVGINNKIHPANATPCCDPDPITGHWTHWVPVDEIERGAEQLGWELDELLEKTLEAMKASENIINAEMEAGFVK